MIVFTKHKSIRRHTNESLKGCPISPKCIILLNYPIFPRCTKYFLKNYFQLPIGQFYLATSLWVACSCNLVSHSIFSQDVIKQLIIEVSNVVTNCCSKCVKYGENIFLYKFYYHPRIISGECYCLHPLRHVIHNQQIYIHCGNGPMKSIPTHQTFQKQACYLGAFPYS